MKKKQKTAREVAFEVLFKFERTFDRLDELTEAALERNELNAKNRRFFKNLTAGVVRHRLFLDWVGSQLYKGRYNKLLSKFKVLLRMALYELLFLTAIPPHATVDEYAGLSKKRADVRHSKIMNGLLRSFLRKKPTLDPDKLIQDPVKRLSVKYSFPEWLIKRWIGFWGEKETEDLCAALNQNPDFDIHINTQKISSKKFKNLLRSKLVFFEESEHDPDVIRVKDLQPFIRERWFERGYCVVQDESAALAVDQLEIKEGDRILDVCAAPGGKYLQLLKKRPRNSLIVATDIDKRRLLKVKQNVERLELEGGIFVVADGRHPPFKKAFNQILIDAPCTGLGVIRKHPDIKWRRTFEEIVEFSGIQKELLQSADDILIEGGLLVYSTCTVDYFENENVVENFLTENKDKYKSVKPRSAHPSMLQGNYLRIYPHKHQMDGSFCARLKKK
ncbi:MAG: 16S rRNA (cytosine(967)-C(5))-methyltransferase RsmB [Calditrichaeota bacterium]|nr:16S rRNA (cytosine(967)-C(5))-methyltransferase RsmB [Calditrichota bacterium]